MAIKPSVIIFLKELRIGLCLSLGTSHTAKALLHSCFCFLFLGP